MRHQDKDRKKLRGIFPVERNTIDKEKSTNDADDSLQYYEVASDEIVKRFEVIIGADGKRYSFSYSLLPVCIQQDSGLLYLKAFELLITIKGRGLDAIHRAFSQEQLKMIKSSPSGKDDGSTDVFIEEIIVEGNATIETI